MFKFLNNPIFALYILIMIKTQYKQSKLKSNIEIYITTFLLVVLSLWGDELIAALTNAANNIRA